MRSVRFYMSVLAAVGLLMVGCGVSFNPSQPYDLRAYILFTGVFQMSGYDSDGTQYAGTMTIADEGTEVINGGVYIKQTTVFALHGNNGSDINDSYYNYYTTAGMHYRNVSGTVTCTLSSSYYTVPTDAKIGYGYSYTMLCSDNSVQTYSVKLTAPGNVEQKIQLANATVTHDTLIENSGIPVSGTLESQQSPSGFTLFLNIDGVQKLP